MKIPLGTQYVDEAELLILLNKEALSDIEKHNLFLANTSVESHISTMTFYVLVDETLVVPTELKRAVFEQFKSIENGSITVDSEGGSFSIGSYSESDGKDSFNDIQTFELSKACKMILLNFGYLYKGRVNVV